MPCQPLAEGLSSGVRWLDALERRMEWLSFPGLFKYLTFLGVIAYACQWARPEIGHILEFDRAAVFEDKEIWRIFTFIFAPMGMRSFSAPGALFLFFAVMISFMISDSLEQAWGPKRTTLYIVAAILGMMIFQLAIGPEAKGGGSFLYSSLFFAFATLFPKVEFVLFFLIPVQVRFLAMISAVLMAISCVMWPPLLWLVVPAMLPYCLWVLPDVARGRKSLVQAAQRRRKFTVAKGPSAEPFHVCEICRRTEHDPADLQFFVTPDGKEYCSEHLPPQS
ncbi:hypothetical protein OJ996_16010 [Luteolibacter sp. GHJ8]|uniref:Peptidase S54 rhomboid domain-containing protein n=1 Tax=Luteolibacter rhizosphaerae TaxID=2989719 RepID=A0ABT3G609_9BACT|nr:hypothetical protein [Luteolibacter rhizosphaerae]MCW1915092.1 hypothetical protein [Luteolibacter rhizosphaerae]